MCPSGIASVIEPDRPLVDGVEIETDLGTWRAYETPGHAPSHVCLYQPERRLLISGDHVLGRISLFYDYGWTPDPAGEFLRSLDVVDRLDARLGLSGHGRPFVDVGGHIEATRELVRERIEAVRAGARRRAEDGARDRAVGLRGPAHPAERQLAADRDALVPDAPRAARRGGPRARRRRGPVAAVARRG